MIKRQILTFAACAAMAWTALGQSLPQFSYDDYDGWSYNNPGMELNADNIGDGRIVLYVSTGGLVLQLISPSFACQGIDRLLNPRRDPPHRQVMWMATGRSTSAM